MPIEIITLHSTITSVPNTFYVVQDYVTSSPVTYGDVDRAFWDEATVSWSGGSFPQMVLQYYGNTGWTNLIFVTPGDSGAKLLDLGGSAFMDILHDNFTSIENVENPSTLGGLRWSIQGEGSTLPSQIVIQGDWQYEHATGRDPNENDLVPYTMRQAAGDEVSLWMAPRNIQMAADSELLVATLARAGYDHDVQSDYYAIGIFARELILGGISGEYLGSIQEFTPA